MLNEPNPADQNSKLLKISFGPLNYVASDAPSVYQTISLSRPPSVPVLGRRLSSESIITVKDESLPKYPFAVEVGPKKAAKAKMHQKLLTKIENFKPKALKVKEKEESKHKSVNNSPVTQVKKIKTREKSVGKSSRNESPVRDVKTPEKKRQVKEILELVQKSLKKEKKLKKTKEKNEKLKNVAKEKLKNEIKALNLCAREDNLKHFKQKLFNPRRPWGVDEKKPRKSTERKKEQNLPLEVLNQHSKRIHPGKRSKNITPEISPSKRSHSARPEIQDFIKKQKVLRKKSKEKEVKKKVEKENRRITQLKQINQVSKKALKKKPKKKSPQKPLLRKCPEFKWLDRYLDNMSEFSHDPSYSNRSELIENKKKMEFGVIDNFELFENEQNEKKDSGPRVPLLSAYLEKSADSSEFVLEDNSKILRLKKNKQEKDEINKRDERREERKEEEFKREDAENKKKTKKTQKKDDIMREEIKKEEKINIEKVEFKEKIQKKQKKDESRKINDSEKEEKLMKEKLERVKQQIEEEYLLETCSLKFQAAAKGWQARKQFKTQSHEDSPNHSNSWIFKKLYPSNSDSDSLSEENEEFDRILKVFNIATDKLKGFDEKIKDFSHKSIESSKIPPEESLKAKEKSKSFVADYKELVPSPAKSEIKAAKPAKSQSLSLHEQKSEIVPLNPIPKGHNLNLSEISIRLIQEQQNLDLLEQESKELPTIITPSSPRLHTLALNPEPTSEEIIKLFQEVINKKYLNLDSILEKNIQVLKDALTDSLSSKSKTESLELKKKLEKISSEDNPDDLDQLLKDLIGTQDIRNIELEVLQEYFYSFPGSRNSPIPEEVTFNYPVQLHKQSEPFNLPQFCQPPQMSLEKILSQDSSLSSQSSILSPVSEYLDELEPHIISDLILENLDVFVIDLTESLISALLENEVLLINEEFHQSMSEENLLMFTQNIFSRFGATIAHELRQVRGEDPLEILAMMQESEIGLGTYPEVLESVIDPKVFLEVVNEDPLQVCIYKKMIFDCINENLNRFVVRDGMPWEGKGNKRIEDVEEIFEKVKSRIIKFNECKIGKIFGATSEFTDGINQVREEKILKVLDFECREAEEKWVKYEFEEDQAKLDVADMVLESLVEEMINVI